MPSEHYKSPARISKEQFRSRREHLLKSAKAITQDAAIYMVVRRSDVYYVHNSEPSENWLPTKGDEVKPFYQRHSIANKYAKRDGYKGEKGTASSVDQAATFLEDGAHGSLSSSALTDPEVFNSAPKHTHDSYPHGDLGSLALPEPNMDSESWLCLTDLPSSECSSTEDSTQGLLTDKSDAYKRLRKPPSIWTRREWNKHC